jgi:hypothetical protein
MKFLIDHVIGNGNYLNILERQKWLLITVKEVPK